MDLDWNDVRYFLAVARHGSTIAAARAIGVNQSTVQRRVAELERQLGRAIVERYPTGYALTAFGKTMVPIAEGVEQAIGKLTSAASAGADRDVIRLTCPEPVVDRIMPLIRRFEGEQPGIRVEIVTSDRYLDLLKGEADIAFRSGDTDHALTGRKIADSVWGVYASRDYIEHHGRPGALADIDQHKLASLDDSMAPHRVVQWIAQVAPNAEVAARSNSMLGLVKAVHAGAGIAPLPMAIADDAGLELLFGPVPELDRTWRILTHPRLRRSPRIAAFFSFVEKEKKAFSRVFG